VATNGAGPVRFTGLDTLRVKECDRIEGISILLSLVGGNATIDGNDLIVRPLEQRTDTPITLPTMDDHRMAMAGAVLGLWRGSVRIDDADVVTKSWPTFWHDLAPLGGWEAV
jgi:3-phosphoshikimate 1-carboxyvinyltransferase